MAEIKAADVAKLRKSTGAGMMDCKKALQEADGDFEKAIDLIRQKGQAIASKRADREASEGNVQAKVSGKYGAMISLNCETDFVAKNEDFVALANEVIENAFADRIESVDQLYTKKPELKEKVNELLGKIGEKIEVSRVVSEKADNGILVDYIHMGSKLGVLIKFDNVNDAGDDLYKLGKDFAMQVAAMNPISVYREEIPQDKIDKEIEIYKEVARKEGKPDKILDKIAQGKLNKFYQENCLSEQTFIKDNSKTVGEMIKEFNATHNTEVKISLFHRFHLGDDKK